MFLKKKVEDLQTRQATEPNNDEIAQNLRQAQSELDKFHLEKTKALIIQSRIQYYEEGERNSKFFLNLVKTRQDKSLIRSLEINNEIESKPEKIIEEIKIYYEKLYTSGNTEDPSRWLADLEQTNSIPKIRDEDKELLSKPITKEELLKSLKTFPKNKSPGNDGLPVEFYMVFWNRISDLYLESLIEGLEFGELSTSQKQTIIRLIGKKDRNKQLLKNWRPLNMINCDVKIFTKALTIRSTPCLKYIIHPNQTAYVKGRFIGEGIKTIDGVINYIKEHKLDAYVLAIDFEKAFDSLEWSFLWRTLKAFEFPDFYINAIKTVYNNIETCVINGATTSKYFQVTRSARQGDPLSAIIFIVALEVLLIRIRQNKDIRGLTI